MKFINILVVAVSAAFLGAGCSEPRPAEDVTKQIQALPADQRFAMIKSDKVMSLSMKDIAIDNLPASDDQKKAWKAEIRQGGESAPPSHGGPTPAPSGK